MIQSSNNGAYVPNTYVWDAARIQTLNLDPDLKELLVRLYQNLADVATVLNLKDTGYYSLGEFVNSQLFFPNLSLTSETSTTATWRNVTRLVVNFGALPNNTSKSVAHGLTPTSSWTFTRIYGCASDTTDLEYIPVPSSQANLTVNSTNVTITTTANLTNYNVCYVILEYLKF